MENYIKFLTGDIPYQIVPELLIIAHVDQNRTKKVIPIATGFAAYSGNYLVILSAAHAFNNLQGEAMLIVGSNGSVSLARAKIVIEKTFDIAVIFLDTDYIKTLFKNLLLVQAENIPSVSDSGAGSIYQVHGFPASKNKFNRSTGWIPNYMRVSFGGERNAPKRTTFPLERISPFCFELSLKNLFDDDGKPDNKLGRLQGMSGSPVYRYAKVENGVAGKLIGMFVHWDKDEQVASVVPWKAIESFVTQAAMR